MDKKLIRSMSYGRILLAGVLLASLGFTACKTDDKGADKAGNKGADKASTQPANKTPATDTTAVTLQLTASDVTSAVVHTFKRQLPVSGVLQPVSIASIKAQVGGLVTSVRAQEGERVGRGQVLVQLDTTELNARLAQQQAQLDSSTAARDFAQKRLEQSKPLLEKGYISQTEYDRVVNDLAQASAQIRISEAGLILTQKAQRDATVTASTSGIVAARQVNVGDKISTEQVLFTIADVSEMELSAPVPAADIGRVRVGLPLALSAQGSSQVLRGRVQRIAPVVENNSRSVPVYVRIPNNGGALKGGMYLQGALQLGAKQALAVPQAATLMLQDGSTQVWVVKNNKLHKGPITVGEVDAAAAMVEVLDGLAVGDRVMVSGLDTLLEGQGVTGITN
mgnify:CR=1 FL=1